MKYRIYIFLLGQSEVTVHIFVIIINIIVIITLLLLLCVKLNVCEYLLMVNKRNSSVNLPPPSISHIDDLCIFEPL